MHIVCVEWHKWHQRLRAASIALSWRLIRCPYRHTSLRPNIPQAIWFTIDSVSFGRSHAAFSVRCDQYYKCITELAGLRLPHTHTHPHHTPGRSLSGVFIFPHGTAAICELNIIAPFPFDVLHIVVVVFFLHIKTFRIRENYLFPAAYSLTLTRTLTRPHLIELVMTIVVQHCNRPWATSWHHYSKNSPVADRWTRHRCHCTYSYTGS